MKNQLVHKIKNNKTYLFIRQVFYFHINLLSHFIYRINNRYDQTDKIVFFDIKNNDYHRYNLIFPYWFIKEGYRVYFKIRFNFLANLWGYSKEIIHFRNISFIPYVKKKANMKFTNIAQKAGYIYISHDYFNKKPGAIEFPYPMHPNMYKKGIYNLIEKSQESEKQIQIFFAGNTDEKYYTNRIINEYFHLLNRFEVINTLKTQINNKTYIPSNVNELKKYISSNKRINKIILIEKSNFSLNTKEYIYFLSKSTFFLAAPGVVMPYCHNIIEAIKLGAIPVLEFPELFSPPLEHEINCIAFKGKDELVDVLNNILNGKYNNMINKLRNNLKEYYRSNLSPKSFIEKLESNKTSINEIYLNAEEISVSLIRK